MNANSNTNNGIVATMVAESLGEAKLPRNPYDLVGKLFQFNTEWGSHHEILMGSVTGISISDEGGLDVYVSIPRFWGRPLISIKFDNGNWYAYIFKEPTEDIKSRFFKGYFTLLP